jgi:hypothetical protein
MATLWLFDTRRILRSLLKNRYAITRGRFRNLSGCMLESLYHKLELLTDYEMLLMFDKGKNKKKNL